MKTNMEFRISKKEKYLAVRKRKSNNTTTTLLLLHYYYNAYSTWTTQKMYPYCSTLHLRMIHYLIQLTTWKMNKKIQTQEWKTKKSLTPLLQFCKNLPSICHREINIRNKQIKLSIEIINWKWSINYSLFFKGLNK